MAVSLQEKFAQPPGDLAFSNSMQTFDAFFSQSLLRLSYFKDLCIYGNPRVTMHQVQGATAEACLIPEGFLRQLDPGPGTHPHDSQTEESLIYP